MVVSSFTCMLMKWAVFLCKVGCISPIPKAKYAFFFVPVQCGRLDSKMGGMTTASSSDLSYNSKQCPLGR